jgi:hypothetical protein
MEADVRLLADDATTFRRASSPARMTLAPRMRANVSALLRHVDAAAPTGVVLAEEAAERHQQLLEHMRFCTMDAANLLLGRLEAMRQEFFALVAGRRVATPPQRGSAPEAPIDLDEGEDNDSPPPPYAERGRQVTTPATKPHGLCGTSLVFLALPSFHFFLISSFCIIR